MIVIEGRYATAKIFTDDLEAIAREQIVQLCDMRLAEGSKIRIMPDVHAGAGCTIGTTMTVTDGIVPNLVGVDIGCGMETIVLSDRRLELQKLDKLIHQKIPCGKNIRNHPHPYNEKLDLTRLKCRGQVNLQRAEHSLGTLGGGNHFIEVNRDEEGRLYLVIHSGSRHLGLQVAKYYQEEGYRQLNQKGLSDIPYNLAYVSGELMQHYIHDMKIIQHFAVWNRKAMMDELVRGMKLHVIEEFTTIHNYIDIENNILRKGAVSAKKDEQILIPMNMRDGSLLCKGKGNEDWNCSAPHGAGRKMSRTAAKSAFTLTEFKRQMQNVYTTSLSRATLDECPMAYKKMEEIMEEIHPTAEVQKVLKPIYNFKAAE